MFDMPLLAVIHERAANWSIGVGITMLVCNLFAIAIGRYAINRRGVGPKLPIQFPDPFGGEFATTSFGHVLGAGAILGLTNAGVL